MQTLRILAWLVVMWTSSSVAEAQRFRARQQTRATGVLEPETQDFGRYNRIVSASIDILPEVSRVLDTLSRKSAPSQPSDSNTVEKVISAFLPLSKKVYVAAAKAEGAQIDRDQISRLNAAEYVMPFVIQFMKRMRSIQFLGEGQKESNIAETRGALDAEAETLGLGKYENMVSATTSLLPVLAGVFEEITIGPDRLDPADPDFMVKIVSAFLPVSRQVLEAVAKAQGRDVKSDEFRKLDLAIPMMPDIFRFLERLRKDKYLDNTRESAYSIFRFPG